MSSLDYLFNPASIVLIGAAHTGIKLGGIALKNLLNFRGKIYPVNPKYDEIMGVKAYRTIGRSSADLGIIMRPAEVPEIRGPCGQGEMRHYREFRLCRSGAGLQSRCKEQEEKPGYLLTELHGVFCPGNRRYLLHHP
jgi:hypothetical protein